MKSRKWILLAAAILCVLLLCAFTVIPTVRLSYGDHIVDVSYRTAQTSGDELLITVNYDSAGEFFEIGRDITVATDDSFSNMLRMKSCSAGEGNYVYKFSAANINSLSAVYIEPPILYMPVEITPVSVALIEGEMMGSSDTDVAFETAGEDWFSISSVEVTEFSEECYLVKVVADAKTLDLPRFPKLCIGDKQLGGITALSFDKNDNFDYGDLLFYVDASSEEEVLEMLKGASLLVSDALVRVDAEELAISANVKSLSVIVRARGE